MYPRAERAVPVDCEKRKICVDGSVKIPLLQPFVFSNMEVEQR